MNTELIEFFTNDLMDEGNKNPVVHSVPEGEVSFVFGLIKGGKAVFKCSSIQGAIVP